MGGVKEVQELEELVKDSIISVLELVVIDLERARTALDMGRRPDFELNFHRAIERLKRFKRSIRGG